MATTELASDYQGGSYRPLSTGPVLSRAFATIGANPAVVFGIVFLMGSLPGAVLHYVLGTFNLTPASASSTVGRIGGVLTMSMIDLIFNLVAVAALARVAVAAQIGGHADLSDTIRAAVARPASLILVALLYALGTIGGLVALVIPGIILSLMWSVVLPVFVNERTGVVAAFQRSRELTSGFRGSIFAIQIVVGVLTTLIAVLFGFLTSSLFGVSSFGETYSLNLGVVGLNLIGRTVGLAITAIIPAILYVELTERKSGAPSDALTAIFE